VSRVKRWLVLAAVVCWVAACGDRTGTPGTSAGPAPTAIAVTVTFVGAGDIAVCGSAASERTARLLDGIQGTVFTIGDHAYEQGTAQQFRDCYGPTWGRHKARTRPAPGNHDYMTPDAAPYFDYFASNAGPPGVGYYRFDVGNWTAFSLNSNIPIGEGSAQLQWLRSELARQPTACTLAYWHHPLYGASPHAGFEESRAVWRELYEARAEIVLNAHAHLYERFSRQDPEGVANNVRGIRQFTIGTGGADLHQSVPQAPNSVILYAGYGVLKLNLSMTSYTWEFIDINGQVRDSGLGTCQ
jgi:acid phosphatase type 7